MKTHNSTLWGSRSSEDGADAAVNGLRWPRGCVLQLFLQVCMGPPPSTCAAGILICEGEEADVAEFVHRLRALRWKAMAVRLELLQSGLDVHSEG